MSHGIACPFVFILLCDIGRHGGVLKQYEIWSVVSIFGCCGPFLQNSGQFLGQIVMRLVKIFRVCRIVACSMLFILL